MPRITRRIEFDYGHRVLGHEGKCRNLHGHRGVAEITVEAAELDSLGRVVDFGVIKKVVGGWIDENWDHNMLLHAADPLWSLWLGNDFNDQHLLFAGKEPYCFPPGKNPTAEVIAEVLFHKAQELLTEAGGLSQRPPGYQVESYLKVVNVRMYETPNCWADYSG